MELMRDLIDHIQGNAVDCQHQPCTREEANEIAARLIDRWVFDNPLLQESICEELDTLRYSLEVA